MDSASLIVLNTHRHLTAETGKQANTAVAQKFHSFFLLASYSFLLCNMLKAPADLKHPELPCYSFDTDSSVTLLSAASYVAQAVALRHNQTAVLGKRSTVCLQEEQRGDLKVMF